MKMKTWAAAAFVAGGTMMAMRGCGGGASGEPDERVASRFSDLCAIAKGGIKDPVKGVQKYGLYLVAHSGDMMKDFGDTIGMIESIRDDEKHDQRAYKARNTMFTPIDACAATFVEFSDAVESNPEASKIVERAADRLERTFNIVFSGAGAERFALRDLPSRFERMIDSVR